MDDLCVTEISEIPEDLVDGKVASDEDELMEEETELVRVIIDCAIDWLIEMM